MASILAKANYHVPGEKGKEKNKEGGRVMVKKNLGRGGGFQKKKGKPKKNTQLLRELG